MNFSYSEKNLKKKLLLEQKDKLNLKLRQVNDELEQFTYMASHDLKSPLRTILAICNLLKDDNLSTEDLHIYLDLIKSDALKINKLVSSLLEYSKIGFVNVEMSSLDLGPIVEKVVDHFNFDSDSKKTNITIGVLPRINGSEVLLTQLFENILSNALKYNDNEIPEIIIRTAADGNSVEIVDNGIGIPKKRIHDIFKAFIRLHSSNKYEGSGVGLATCKKIMDIHLGTISVISEEEKGSTFILTFMN